MGKNNNENKIGTHIISVTVENRFGVLAKISGLFSARGYNIDSLSVAETEDPSISKMTIVVKGDEKILEQINKQLNKLIDVIKVVDLTKEEHIERELALIKVNTPSFTERQEVMQLTNIFRGKIVDVGKKTLTIEISGNTSKIKAMLELLKGFGIKEIIRTGKIAISREFERKGGER